VLRQCIIYSRNECKTAFTLEKYFFPKVVDKKELTIILLLLGNGICDNVAKEIKHQIGKDFIKLFGRLEVQSASI
jgi:hypothetical protein